MITVTLTPDLENIIVERAEQRGTTPELYVLDELRSQHLAGSVVLRGNSDLPFTLLQRRALLRLPISERRRILAEQADQISSHYEHDTEWRELHDGDIIEY